MKIEYTISEDDFLAFQLFTSSQSERINKKKKKGRIFLTLTSLAIAMYFFFIHSILVAVYCLIISIFCALFYPKYFIWRYKKHYQNFIKESYSKRFGEKAEIELLTDSIRSKDKTGEGTINTSEIENVNETARHFFIKISTGLSLIIPKRDLNNSAEVKAKFSSIGLTVTDFLSWEWK